MDDSNNYTADNDLAGLSRSVRVFLAVSDLVLVILLLVDLLYLGDLVHLGNDLILGLNLVIVPISYVSYVKKKNIKTKRAEVTSQESQR